MNSIALSGKGKVRLVQAPRLNGSLNWISALIACLVLEKGHL